MNSDKIMNAILNVIETQREMLVDQTRMDLEGLNCEDVNEAWIDSTIDCINEKFDMIKEVVEEELNNV